MTRAVLGRVRTNIRVLCPHGGHIIVYAVPFFIEVYKRTKYLHACNKIEIKSSLSLT